MQKEGGLHEKQKQFFHNGFPFVIVNNIILAYIKLIYNLY